MSRPANLPAYWDAARKSSSVLLNCLGYSQNIMRPPKASTRLLGSQVGLYVETFNQKLEQWGTCPRGYYGFALVESEGACLLSQVPCDSSTVVCLTPITAFGI